MVEHANEIKLEKYTLTYFRGHKEIVSLPKQFRRMFLEDLTVGKVILKTSNDVLDLVEVGDLVESSEENHETYGDLMLVQKIYDDSFYNKVMAFGLPKNKITAIFKKQPNGDYARFEVNRKEGK